MSVGKNAFHLISYSFLIGPSCDLWGYNRWSGWNSGLKWPTWRCEKMTKRPWYMTKETMKERSGKRSTVFFFSLNSTYRTYSRDSRGFEGLAPRHGKRSIRIDLKNHKTDHGSQTVRRCGRARRKKRNLAVNKTEISIMKDCKGKTNLVPRVLSLPTSRKYPGCGWSRVC